MNEILTKEEIEQIKKKLPKGYFRKLRERLGISERTLSKFFNASHYDITIHSEVVKLGEEYQAKIKGLKQRQKKLTEKV